MTYKSKRRWFQIHLSTAVMLMFVAGVLLSMNLSPILIKNDDVVITEYGWPFRLMATTKWFQIHLSTAIVLKFVAGGLIWVNCQSSK